MRSSSSRLCSVVRVGRSRPLILGAAAIAAMVLHSNASAALLSWNNAAGGAASIAGNWSPVQIPAAGDDLSYALNATYAITFNSTVAASNTQTFLGGNITLTCSNPHTVAAGVVIADLSGNTATTTLTTGTMTSNGNVIVGDASGSNGTLNVNDDDADLIIGNGADLIVGNNGDATMNITGIGLVEVADQLIVGSNAASSPVVLVNGFSVAPIGVSTLRVLGTGQSRIGQGGDATMTISNGGVADFAGDVVVSNGSASLSTIIVEDQGLLDSRLIVDGDLLLGRNTSGTAAGSALLDVYAGGTVDVGDLLSVGGDVNGGLGELRVNAGGDVLTTNMQVGIGGRVSLEGGTVSSDNPIAIDANAEVSGFGTINGDISNSGNLFPIGTGMTINGVLTNLPGNATVGNAIHFGPGGGFVGAGVVNASITGDTTALITATGTLDIGANVTGGISYNGDMNVGGNIVTLVDSNGAVLGGDTSINSGRIECSSGIGLANGGRISGDGLMVGNVVCSGELDPTTPGNLGGLLTIQGDLTMNPTGIIDMEIGGPPGPSLNDRINISGTAAFNGKVRIRLKNGYTPNRGEQHIIANATLGRTGTFTTVEAPGDVCTGATFVLVYSTTAAIVLVRPPDADTNDDLQIDVTDLLAVIGHWGEACSNCEFDTNGAEPVNVSDLLVVIANWGSCP